MHQQYLLLIIRENTNFTLSPLVACPLSLPLYNTPSCQLILKYPSPCGKGCICTEQLCHNIRFQEPPFDFAKLVAALFYTIHTNFSTKYLVMCNVYTDVSDILK